MGSGAFNAVWTDHGPTPAQHPYTSGHGSPARAAHTSATAAAWQVAAGRNTHAEIADRRPRRRWGVASAPVKRDAVGDEPRYPVHHKFPLVHNVREQVYNAQIPFRGDQVSCSTYTSPYLAAFATDTKRRLTPRYVYARIPKLRMANPGGFLAGRLDQTLATFLGTSYLGMAKNWAAQAACFCGNPVADTTSREMYAYDHKNSALGTRSLSRRFQGNPSQ